MRYEEWHRRGADGTGTDSKQLTTAYEKSFSREMN